MKKRCLLWFGLLLMVGGFDGNGAARADEMAALQQRPVSTLRLVLVPPSPVGEEVTLDLRGAVVNTTQRRQTWDVAFFLDDEKPASRLYGVQEAIQPGESRGVYFRWPTRGHAGKHQILLVARCDSEVRRAVQTVNIVPPSAAHAARIGGAWAGIYHWSEQEARFWNPEIKLMDDRQWQELVRAMHEAEMDVVVISESFRNQAYVGQHKIDEEGYRGRAFYPSRLFPGRMEIAARDPFDSILSEADRLGMQVFVPVGMYAWFDFTPASLAWHKQVATELWQLYGHHPSFYGWYVSEEIAGNLGEDDRRREEIVEFFRQFRTHVRRLAPEKPVMLASNAHAVRQALAYYPQLLSNLDILCPFAFQRMPAGDLSGDQAAALLRKLADEAGAHLWLDLELFLFDNSGSLYPRPILGIADDLQRFPNFEKVLGYQFPGVMSAPWMSRKPGAEPTVKLFNDYRQFLENGAEVFKFQHAARASVVTLDAAPSPPYTGFRNGAGLTDGETGGTNYLDPAWLGYDGKDFAAVIDLKEPVYVKELQARFLQFVPAGIFLPALVEFALGDSPEQLEIVKTVTSALPMTETGPRVEALTVNDVNARARYVRVRAVNPGPIPAWHPAAGGKSWLFVDEILVNPAGKPK